MNYRIVVNTLGKILLLCAVLLIFPLIVGLIYKENTYLSFIIPIVILLALGIPTIFIKPRVKAIYEREGFVIVSFAWMLLSIFGALPFVISKSIPNFFDALFETVSGFTTTGATVLADVESLPRSMLFWRSFTHWIGGMGVLVFVLAILPDAGSGSMHVLRAESTGPTVGKLVSKMKVTARILYAIYFVMTVILVVMLVLGEMPIFDSLITAFGTAGTGGFSCMNASIAAYDSVYIEMVVAVFMMLFGVSFNVYYLVLIGSVSKALLNEELRAYLIIMAVATLVIALDILDIYTNFGQALRYSYFQVSSIMTTTGFATTDFDLWPTLSKTILVLLMFIGGCAGSTGGGMKVSRVVILGKSSYSELKKMVKPRSVVSVKFDGEIISEDTIKKVRVFFVVFMGLLAISTFLVAIEGYGTLVSNFTASLSCISNIGPGLEIVGPTGNFSGYSSFSKVVFSIDMLAGRLEFFPIMILFSPATWKRN